MYLTLLASGAQVYIRQGSSVFLASAFRKSEDHDGKQVLLPQEADEVHIEIFVGLMKRPRTSWCATATGG